MRTVIEHRMPLPSDGEAILNALPNPVLLVAPDGKIVDANIAAESFSRFPPSSCGVSRSRNWCRSAAPCWR